MGGDRQRRFGEDAFQRVLLVDEQVAGAGADEDLDAGRAMGAAQLGDVVGRRADVEAVVDERLLGGQREFFVQPLLAWSRAARCSAFRETW